MFDNYYQRLVLFLIGCIGTRLLITYVVKVHPPKYRIILAILLALPALGFTYIYAFGLRKTGLEVGGDRIWWDKLRPFHACMYFLASYLVLTRNSKAYWALVIDTLIGLISFASYHLGFLKLYNTDKT